jgi:hypothetical protein
VNSNYDPKARPSRHDDRDLNCKQADKPSDVDVHLHDAEVRTRIDVNAYFTDDRREIDVVYKNKRYRLRLTAQDKLLLTT